MKKTIYFLMSILLALSLVACGETTPTTPSQPDTSPAQESEPVKSSTDCKMSDGVYKCGTDIMPGAYSVTIDGGDGWIDYLVFSSVDAYMAYQTSGATTIAEDSLARCQNAYSYTDIIDEAVGYIELDEGNVIIYTGEESTLTPWTMDSGALYQGTYVVGKNFVEGSYRLTAADEHGIGICLFETIDDYTGYFSSNRFSVGDEQDALDAFASYQNLVYDDDEAVISVKNGQVMMIYGTANFDIF